MHGTEFSQEPDFGRATESTLTISLGECSRPRSFSLLGVHTIAELLLGVGGEGQKLQMLERETLGRQVSHVSECSITSTFPSLLGSRAKEKKLKKMT